MSPYEPHLVALRIEYIAAKRELELARAEMGEQAERVRNMASNVMGLYLKIYCLEHDLAEDDV